MEDISECFEGITPDFDLTVLGEEDELEIDGLVGIMEAQFERVRGFQLVFILFGPSHEKALTNPLYVPCVPLYVVKSHSASDLILWLFNSIEFPKLRQSDLEPFHLVNLAGVAGMHEYEAVDFTEHDVFCLEGVLGVGGAIELDRQDGFFEGQSADVSVNCSDFQHEALVGVVDVSLEVEVLAQHVLALLLRWRTRGNLFLQLRYLKLKA